ncbi:PREDICTED: uncharacterized protein LOC109469216 isoform X2 [Branchiostoma belcheri]|uniref:Transmembrane protein 196 n=1 Tax=Branchiostoma belcheri TaxID=7741 RepID=A0A6P4YFK3_BRABE|nr:PREDICTED: uncharacterized protein LOC109469216 isoform X2 [Branchiostoma belcheri]
MVGRRFFSEWEERQQNEEALAEARRRREMRAVTTALVVLSSLTILVGLVTIGSGIAAAFQPGNTIGSVNSLSAIACGTCILCFTVGCTISLIFSLVYVQLLRLFVEDLESGEIQLFVPTNSTFQKAVTDPFVTVALGKTCVVAAGIGCATTIILTFLACRVASEEKRRLFMLREGIDMTEQPHGAEVRTTAI